MKNIHPLYQFLLDRFSTAELRRFFALHYPELANELTGRSMSAAELAMQVATSLQRSNAVDAGLFAALERDRPRLKAMIDQLRQHFEAAPGEVGAAIGGGSSPAAVVRPDRRLRVAFVAANPVALPELQLAAEAKRIEDKLRETPGGSRIDFRWYWRAGPDSLMDLFVQDAPDVLHFAGHGAENGALLLQTSEGRAHPVAPEALAELIAARPVRPRMIVLNACFSAVMARALTPFVDLVVGMRESVEDLASRRFAVEFYRAVAHGDAVQTAFDTARASLRLFNLANDEMPQLSVRGDVDPRAYRLL